MSAITIRRSLNRQQGSCGWWDDDTPCTYYGPLVKGLCRRHYDTLGHRLREEGLLYGKDHRPTTCTCSTPSPIPCRILNGRVTVPGAFQCSVCWRAVL